MTLAFVELGCGTNFEKLKALVFVIPLRFLPLMSFLRERVWVLGLLNCEEEVLNALDFESKLIVL